MRKFFVVLAALAICTLAAHAQTKVAVVDLRKLFDEYYKTKLADANLKDEAGDLEKDRKDMVDQLRKGEEEWKKLLDKANDQAISAEERDKTKQEAEKKLLDLRDKEETLKQFERSARAKLAEKHRRKRDTILEEIRAIINSRAKAQGYNLVVDSAAESINSTPIVLFSSSQDDLTEAILSELNASAPPSALKALEDRKEEKPAEKTPEKK
jgi:outer membrane protein